MHVQVAGPFQRVHFFFIIVDNARARVCACACVDAQVVSRGKGKKDEALGKLGAHAFLDSTDEDAVVAAKGTFDFILDTIAADHDMDMYVRLPGCEYIFFLCVSFFFSEKYNLCPLYVNLKDAYPSLYLHIYVTQGTWPCSASTASVSWSACPPTPSNCPPSAL